jgi:hypothetical protein
MHHQPSLLFPPAARVYVVGCGGVGSWLLPKLVKVVLPTQVTIIDGDMLELKNLDRQLFGSSDIGKNKAEALAEKYPGVTPIPTYMTAGSLEPRRHDVLFGCADNDVARKNILGIADARRCAVIIGANEYTDAEAYYYRSEWKGTARDPRVFYPNILTNREDDPTAVAAGCTGEAAIATPQLVLANDLASSFMLHLFQYHHLSVSDTGGVYRDEVGEDHHPTHHRASFAHIRTTKNIDRPIALPVAA